MRFNFLLFVFLPFFAFASQDVPNLPPKDATRSARTCHDLNGVYVTGDFLYWKARQDGLEYAASFTITPNPPDTDVKIRAFEIDYEYKPGFRIGLGGDLPFKGWDVHLNWTRFRFDISSTTVSNEHNLLILEGNLDRGFGFVGNKATGRWDFSYNSLDFDWGRRLFLDSTLIVRPSFGMKTLWIRHKVRKVLDNVETFAPGGQGIPAPPETVNIDFDVWGIGPFAAFYGKWNWIYGLGLAGSIKGAIIWYDTDVKFFAREDELQGQAVTVTNIDLKYGANRVRPVAELFVGLDWEWCFIPKWLSVQLSIGYETQYLWSMLAAPIDSGASVLPFSFEGLTFKGRLDF